MQDNIGVEYYCIIFVVVELLYEEGVIWVGFDDGLFYLMCDGGKNWMKVMLKGMFVWIMINSVDVDLYNLGGVYVVGICYKLGDYMFYFYYLGDYGVIWRFIIKGIDLQYFMCVLCVDLECKGLLYVGIELGMYISFDSGINW